MARHKDKTGRISVFKGREAKLNRAIFQVLALKGPQTIYNIHKNLKTRRNLKCIRYATVNKRVRSLEEHNFINRIGTKKTRAGFEASIYELTARAYLALLLNSISLEDLFARVNETSASTILGILIGIKEPESG